MPGDSIFESVSIGVLGTGGYVPSRIRSNKEIAELAGVTTQWIDERTGVRQRHVADDTEAASDLAAEAVRRALSAAGLTADEVDVLVLATSTPDELGPSTACRVQALLGAKQAVALDVSAACAGWIFGAHVATDWLRVAAGGERFAVVVGVEAYSRFLDPTDRATAVLFGDGAGAAVLGSVATGKGFGRIQLSSDGTRAGDVLIPAGGSRRPAGPESLRNREHFIHMDGRAVRDFILTTFPKAAAAALEHASLTADEIDVIVAHQPNPILLRTACSEAGFDPERMIMIGDMVGNLGAGSIPYALTKAQADNRLHDGDRILILTFGAGVTWGSTVLVWGKE